MYEVPLLAFSINLLQGVFNSLISFIDHLPTSDIFVPFLCIAGVILLGFLKDIIIGYKQRGNFYS
jgi:hypothetical protein